MANTCKISLSFAAVISDRSVSASASKTVDLTGTRAMDRIVQATTSDATLPLSDFSNVGSLMLTNLDASNSILVDSANTYDKFPQTILPGKSILLSPATITIHYKSSAGTPSMSVTAVEV